MSTSDLIHAIDHSISRAELGQSKLVGDILKVHGAAGKKNRHFLNNILDRTGVRYLEIGTWQGSTLISALYGNSPEYVAAIDNFSQFGGPRDVFVKNCDTWIGGVPTGFVDADCFSIDPVEKGIKNIDTYFYDGEHSQRSHQSALTHYYPALANEFIYIVDDWNWRDTREGTSAAISELGLEVVHKREFFGDENNHNPEEWWNGFFIGVLKKTK